MCIFIPIILSLFVIVCCIVAWFDIKRIKEEAFLYRTLVNSVHEIPEQIHQLNDYIALILENKI